MLARTHRQAGINGVLSARHQLRRCHPKIHPHTLPNPAEICVPTLVENDRQHTGLPGPESRHHRFPKRKIRPPTTILLTPKVNTGTINTGRISTKAPANPALSPFQNHLFRPYAALLCREV